MVRLIVFFICVILGSIISYIYGTEIPLILSVVLGVGIIIIFDLVGGIIDIIEGTIEIPREMIRDILSWDRLSFSQKFGYALLLAVVIVLIIASVILL